MAMRIRRALRARAWPNRPCMDLRSATVAGQAGENAHPNYYSERATLMSA